MSLEVQDTNEPVNTSEGFEELLRNIDPAEPVDPAPESEVDPAPAPSNPETGEQVQQEPEIGALPQGKQNQSFAQMRIQNRQQSLALQTILQKAGLDPSLANDPDQVIRLLEDAEVEEQAERLAVPPELLQRLSYLERVNRQTENERTYQSAAVGFQKIQERFGLDQKDLQSFALQLQQQGINPFEQPVDLMNTFVSLNLDWVLEKERQAAVNEALTRQNKAYRHGTTPAQTQGRPTNDPVGDKINTMAQFDKFIYDLNK